MREAPGSGQVRTKKVKSVGRTTAPRALGRPQTAREAADRAIANLPARSSAGQGGFETGRRHNEERAMKRQQDNLMKGPSGDGGGEFQIASAQMLDSLAKAQGVGGAKRKR